MGHKIVYTKPVNKKYFIEFINVHSTNEYDLTDILLNKLNSMGIDLENCQRQACDNRLI